MNETERKKKDRMYKDRHCGTLALVTHCGRMLRDALTSSGSSPVVSIEADITVISGQRQPFVSSRSLSLSANQWRWLDTKKSWREIWKFVSISLESFCIKNFKKKVKDSSSLTAAFYRRYFTHFYLMVTLMGNVFIGFFERMKSATPTTAAGKAVGKMVPDSVPPFPFLCHRIFPAYWTDRRRRL